MQTVCLYLGEIVVVFNSYVFILLFLPVFVILYFLLGKVNRSLDKILIILGGGIFYSYAGWQVAAVLALSIIVNFVFSLIINKSRYKKPFIGIAIALNIVLLFYYKYWNFTIDIINNATKAAFQQRNMILPLGISFFTFQQIMYIVSVGKEESAPNIMDYLSYILFFPKLVMGPLMEPSDFFVQLNDSNRRKVNWENIAGGIKLFSLGLFKKLIFADTFAKAVSWGFENGVTNAATSGDLFLVMLFYTFQIYFDFSGYSDMAIGLSKMINFDLPMNFDSPYKATSVRDFWKRWHMSLTAFLTKYVYFPLGGSRKGQVRTYANIMIVFLVSGIWHGANWTFILWGCIHGLLQVMERLFKKWFDRLFVVVRWGYTFLAVNILWLLFRADSVKNWIEMLRTMFSFKNMAISDGLINTFQLPESTFIFEKLSLVQANANIRGFGMLIFMVSAFLLCLVPENNYKTIGKTNTFSMVVCAIAFVWSFLCRGSESVFVYFNF